MIDLAAYDLLLSERLGRLKSAKGFAERRSLLDLGELSALQEALRPISDRSSQIAGNGLPFSGPRAPGLAVDESIEDEWALRRPASGRGGASGAGSASGGRSGAKPSLPASRHADLASSIAVKAGLAGGAQAAVVKLASFGSGSARAAALLSYQSAKGQLSLEREDGTLVSGKAAVDDLAAHWRDDDARQSSNDVFRVTLVFAGSLADEKARAGLADALDGHRYAWRAEELGEATVLHLVAVAAGARKDEHGKKERIYANAKSLRRLGGKIEDAFGRDVEISTPIWAHGVEGATTQLAALTRGGALSVETDAGVSLDDAANRQFEGLPGNANRSKPEKFNPALEIAKSWRPVMRSSSPRDFAHIILSAKPGTDAQAFLDSARATLAREFSGHEYVFVLHTNRRHIHVHAAVRLTRADGERLHPGIQDFRRWRQTLAEEAKERHLPMEATRRFDQAHAPAYRLKDAKMVERSIAPDSVRRRVERVQTKEIHRPTREEGRHRAAEAVVEWKSVFVGQALPLAAGVSLNHVTLIDSAAALPFLRRAETALTAQPQDSPIIPTEKKVMRTAETMHAARREMADAMTRLGGYLPEGAVKDELMRRSHDILARADAATREQARLERDPGRIVGDRFVEPEPQNVGALFTNEKKGAEVHYSRHDRESGAFQTLAFVDTGKQVDIRDWSNRESVDAALKIASQKWETLSVSGSNEYKDIVIGLAAEKGYEITNPELQDRIRERRAVIEAWRATVTEGKERPAPDEPKAGTAELTASLDRKPLDEPGLGATPAERAIELDSIRDRVDAEATRETRQARRAAQIPESGLARDSQEGSFHAPEEARAAREAEQAVDNNPRREIPPDPAQSEAITTLRVEQKRVLDASRDEQRRIDSENAERFRQEERRQSRDEVEGESM